MTGSRIWLTGWRRWLLAILGMVALIYPFIVRSYFLSLAIEVLIFAIFAMSLDLLLGYTGLPSFGHAAFYGFGAYLLAYLTSRSDLAFNLTSNLLLTVPLVQRGGVFGAFWFGCCSASRLFGGAPIIAGARANCWGWDRQRRIGRLTGYGWRMAEVAGGLELVGKAVQAVALAWTRRGPATRLTDYFIEFTGARDAEDLLEGLSLERLHLDASAAPLVFRAAAEGDVVALDAILWAGRELGSLAIGVIRQLNFEALAFDAVLVGSLYQGSPLLVETMRQTIHTVAPGARFMPLSAPPVVGGVLLGMEQAGLDAPVLRETVIRSTVELLAAR